MSCQPGDFWVAEILFTDGSAAKRRPILVLWIDGQDVVVAAVTSAAPRTPTDIPLGQVTKADAKRLKDAWKAHIKLQF